MPAGKSSGFGGGSNTTGAAPLTPYVPSAPSPGVTIVRTGDLPHPKARDVWQFLNEYDPPTDI